jgi:hypothetical protein
MKLRLIPLSLIIALSCRPSTKDWQVLDFGPFEIKTPSGWSIVKRQGIDSYFGGLTDGKDTLWFDYGNYDVDLTRGGRHWYRMAKDTVNGFPAMFSLPDSLELGAISMKIPRLPNGSRFTIWASNVKDSITVLQIFKSAHFAGSDTSANPPLTASKFVDRTNVDGKLVFINNCVVCHSLSKNVEGPRLEDMIAMRSTDWLYRFFEDREHMKRDAFHEQMKKEFNNLECPENKNLTRADIVAVVYYVEYGQH